MQHQFIRPVLQRSNSLCCATVPFDAGRKLLNLPQVGIQYPFNRLVVFHDSISVGINIPGDCCLKHVVMGSSGSPKILTDSQAKLGEDRHMHQPQAVGQLLKDFVMGLIKQAGVEFNILFKERPVVLHPGRGSGGPGSRRAAWSDWRPG